MSVGARRGCRSRERRGARNAEIDATKYFWAAVVEDFGDRNGDVLVLLEHWPADVGASAALRSPD
ncbi:hypothetical protein [Nocardia transvalensis]|uniref:hypothetical protein n=1 Tax=Nocardia transvalensis TaxID=37333 RepID=UPI001893E894|nr:hypothetical protein [Nocardia transvalensis]MBF6333600.1 hypothetical protein [Nocardia transvalensis]